MSALGPPHVTRGLAADCLYSNTGDVSAHESLHFFNASMSKCYVILPHDAIFCGHCILKVLRCKTKHALITSA